LQLLSSKPIVQNAKVLFEKTCFRTNAFFDNRFELNSDLKPIIEMTRPNISPDCRPNCQNPKQLHAVLSEVLACHANCWQMIAISCQVMFGNI